MRGVYTLLIYLNECKNVKVGSLGKFAFPSGFYSYTGSAMGFGAQSLGGRVSRHILKAKRLKWHIDWLLAVEEARIVSFFTRRSDQRLECIINQSIKNSCGGKVLFPRFGASDCRSTCVSHLLYFGERSPLNGIKEVYRKVLESLPERSKPYNKKERT